jgi:hypothetical protein
MRVARRARITASIHTVKDKGASSQIRRYFFVGFKESTSSAVAVAVAYEELKLSGASWNRVGGNKDRDSVRTGFDQ